MWMIFWIFYIFLANLKFVQDDLNIQNAVIFKII